MDFLKTENKVIYKNEKSIGYKIGLSHDNEFIRLEISNNNSIPSHALDIPMSFYVISGKGILITDYNEIKVSKGNLIEVPPNQKRGWINNSNDKLILLAVKHQK